MGAERRYSVIGHGHWQKTQEETDAGVSIVNNQYPPGDARRYGCLIDGSTDDTTAATDWINAGLQGVPLYHPGGTMLLSTWTQVAVTANLYIWSDANGKIKGTSSDNFLQPGAGDLYLSGLDFDTWSNVLESDESDAGVSDWIRVTNCEFQNVTLYCIDLINEINNILIDGCYFHDLSTGAIKIGDNVYANQDDCQRITITNNHCDTVTNTGAGNTHFALVLGKWAKINNNHVEGISSNTGEAWGIYTKVRYGEVCNNTITNVTSTSSNEIYINIKGEQRASTTSTQGFAIIVANNVLLGTGTEIGISLPAQDVHIHANTCENFVTGVNSSGGGDNISITDNLIIGEGTTNNTWGINVTHTGDHCKVSGNTIHTCENGIRCAPSGAVAHWSLVNNTIDNCSSYGFEILPVSTTITNMLIDGNSVSDATRFALIASCDGLTITNNRFSGLTGNIWQAISLLNGTDGNQNMLIDNNGPIEVQTTDATATIIGFFEIPDNSAIWIEATVIAMESDGSDRNVYKDGFLIYRDGSTAVLQGSVANIITPIESDAAWAITCDANSNAGRIRVTGAAATTINWILNARVQSVS